MNPFLLSPFLSDPSFYSSEWFWLCCDVLNPLSFQDCTTVYEEETLPSGIPPPSKHHLEMLQKAFGHASFRPMQWKIIHAVLQVSFCAVFWIFKHIFVCFGFEYINVYSICRDILTSLFWCVFFVCLFICLCVYLIFIYI